MFSSIYFNFFDSIIMNCVCRLPAGTPCDFVFCRCIIINQRFVGDCSFIKITDTDVSILFFVINQVAFTCFKSTVETPEQFVKLIRSQ